MELPLASRNLNASVYSAGAMFESMGNDALDTLMKQLGDANAASRSVSAYQPVVTDDTDDIDVLIKEVQMMSDSLGKLEAAIIQADIEDDLGEKARLVEKSREIRAQRENAVIRIKALKAA